MIPTVPSYPQQVSPPVQHVPPQHACPFGQVIVQGAGTQVRLQ
jgi:hypothetical protein